MLQTIRIFLDVTQVYLFPGGVPGHAERFDNGAAAGFPAAKKLVLSNAIHDGAVRRLPACSWFR